MDRPLTENLRPDGVPLSLREYEGAGGYEGLRKAVAMAPEDVTNEVKKANLFGRGGAGFSAGLKWSFIPMGENAERPKYMIANADEMEPGTFKDRLLLERDPHQLIEGLVIGAWAIDAELGYIFIRSEYTKGAEIVQRALDEAYEKKYLGKNILGTGFNYDLRLHASAGRYMCGEETGLLNSLEGKRAMPRSKPPHPTASGLWGKPTIVNNVETLCQVPGIIRHGADWFKSLSLTGEGGTKLYGVSGKVKNPGIWELPMGTPIREVIEKHAGGMRDGFQLRAIIPGGASTEFLLPKSFDTPMDFGSMVKVRSRLGTGTIIVLDDKTCPVGLLHNLQTFYARESCGWCTPCRDGLPWVVDTLEALEEGRGEAQDLEILEMHTRFPRSRPNVLRIGSGGRWSRCEAGWNFSPMIFNGIFMRSDAPIRIKDKVRSTKDKSREIIMKNLTRIYIEGKPYDVDGRQNLLHVCLSLGFDVPYFCWHPAMGSVGCCRQCAVRVFRDLDDKRGNVVMSCMTKISEGMNVVIDDPELIAFRATVIEWLMVNHPHDCPVCDEGGECHLQDMTVMTGHTYRQFRFKKKTYVNQNLGPFVNHEMNRCIQCFRCVRFYRDFAGGKDFDVFGAHNHLYFGRHESGTLENEFSGNLVEVCPTGVFTDKTLKKHYTRKWDLQTAPLDLRQLLRWVQHLSGGALWGVAANSQSLQSRCQLVLSLRPGPLWLRIR